MSIVDFPHERRGRQSRNQGSGIDSGGGPPHDGAMEARIAKLEADLTAIKMDVAVIKSNGATKSDIAEAKTAVAEAKSAIIMWVVGAIFLAQVLPALLKLIPAK